jgi:Domain of unknown function (DUF6431)
VVTVRGSDESVEARLRAGQLACWCGGRLRSWGHARRRRVVTFAGPVAVRPRRSRCAGCGRTHVLLPSWLLLRRRYAVAVIFAALALRAAGLKLAAVAARLRLPSPGGGWWSVPASTTASWLARFAGHAGRLRQLFTAVLPLADPQARPVTAAGSPAPDALAVLEAVTAGLRLRFGMDQLAAHEVAAHLTAGMLLAPSLAVIPGNTSLSWLAALTSS